MENLDMFGSIVGITYNGNRSFKTKFGGFISLLCVLVCMIVSIYFIIKQTDKSSWKMFVEEENFLTPPQLNLTDFKFAIVTNYQDHVELHPDILEITPVLVSKSPNNTFTEVALPTIPCNKNMFAETTEQFTSLELEKGICVDTNNVTIEGSYVNKAFSYLSVRVTHCRGKSICPNETITQNAINEKNPFVVLYVYDSTFQPSYRVDYIRNFFNSQEVPLNFRISKFVNLYLSNNELQFDYSYFGEGEDYSLNAIMLDSVKDSMYFKTSKNENMAELNLMVSKNKKIVKIVYLKITDFIVNVMAVTSHILLFFNLLVNKINHSIFIQKLLRESIGLKTPPKTISHELNINTLTVMPLKMNKPRGMIKINDIPGGNNNNNNNNNNNDNKDVIGFKEYYKLTRAVSKEIKTRKAMLYMVLNTIFFCKTVKNYDFQFYKKLEERMNEKIDLKGLLLRYQDVELMKYLLFDNSMLSLFNLAKRPIFNMSLNTVDYTNPYSRQIFSEPKSLDDMEEIFNGFKNKAQKSREENKMLNLFRIGGSI
jgi:hypothetical protein